MGYIGPIEVLLGMLRVSEQIVGASTVREAFAAIPVLYQEST